jgi:hypothetical protein
VHPKSEWESIMNAWEDLMDSPCESAYDERLSKLKEVLVRFPVFGEYVQNTWLIPHKKRFISEWTNTIMHLGNTTTNRYSCNISCHYYVNYFIYLLTNCYVCL